MNGNVTSRRQKKQAGVGQRMLARSFIPAATFMATWMMATQVIATLDMNHQRNLAPIFALAAVGAFFLLKGLDKKRSGTRGETMGITSTVSAFAMMLVTYVVVIFPDQWRKYGLQN